MPERRTRLGLRDSNTSPARKRRSLPAVLATLLTLAAFAGILLALSPDRPVRTLAARGKATAARYRMPGNERYPYGGPEFSRFVSESRGGWRGGDTAFYRWMDAQLPLTAKVGPPPRAWASWTDDKRRALDAIRDPKARVKAERDLCATVHRRVKLAIPRFSLDRGFEFQHTVTYGERQCFLQSVLIAGLLQRAGLDAGVVMVYRNPKGQESNNGHAVNLVVLGNGASILVDASEQHPFATHKGIFAWDARARDYRFLSPQYAADASIIRFTRAGSGDEVPIGFVRTLPRDFMRSQFEYYRGERAPGGLVAKKPTPAGLNASRRHLQASAKMCPANPLPKYMLMRASGILGDTATRDRAARDARALYGRYGWVPGGFPE